VSAPRPSRPPRPGAAPRTAAAALAVALALSATACTGQDASEPVAPSAADATGAGRAAEDPAGLPVATSSGGTRPEVSWDAMDGAATYRVTVVAADGGPPWAWEGSATSVALGGRTDERGIGFRLVGDAVLTVLGVDADGGVVGFQAYRLPGG